MVTFVVLRIVAVVLLVAANAFFVAAEFALVSVRETRLQQMIAAHRIGARTVQKLHQKLDEVLNAVQFGVTVCSLALGWIGEASIAHMLEPLFLPLPFSRFYAHAAAVALAFVLMTYLVVILGEVVPKSITLQRTDRVALAVAGPMDVFMTLASPFLVFMTASTRVVLKAFGVHLIRQAGIHSPEELKLIVSANRRLGVLAPMQEELILHALELENIAVREIMVPRPDIFQPVRSFPLKSRMGFPHLGVAARFKLGARLPDHCQVLPSGPLTVPDKRLPVSVAVKIMSAGLDSSSLGETKVSWPFEISTFGSGREFPQRPTMSACSWPDSSRSSSHEGYSRPGDLSVKSQRPRNDFRDAGDAGGFSDCGFCAWTSGALRKKAAAKMFRIAESLMSNLFSWGPRRGVETF